MDKEDEMRVASRGIAAGAGALALMVALAVPAFGQPQVNVKSGKFDSAKEKNAAKALRMKEGYKGDAAARDLANKLLRAARSNDSVQLKGDDKSNALMHVSRNDPSAHFRIDKTTGDFSFSKGLKGIVGDRATSGLPTKEQAPDLAKKYLSDLGLMPEKQDELVLRHVGGLRQVDLLDGKPTAPLDKLVTVHFGRQIDGIDVGGPGSKIVVDLGANGELVGVQRRWIEVNEEKKNDADLKGQSEVINDVKAKIRGEASKAKRADSSAPDFGYFDDGKGNIEPAYFFNADLAYDGVDEEGKPAERHEKYFGAVPALKGSKADFVQLEKAGRPPGRPPAAQAEKPSQKD